VTVNDSEAPLVNGCPGNIEVDAALGAASAVVSWTEPAATDNCPGIALMRVTGPAPGAEFPIGKTVVTYVAVDTSGNTSVCSFDVQVSGSSGPCTKPTITCPGNISVPAPADGQC